MTAAKVVDVVASLPATHTDQDVVPERRIDDY